MKKFLIFVASAAMMASCGISREETDRELKQQRDSLQAIIDNKDNELNDIIRALECGPIDGQIDMSMLRGEE